MLGQGDLCEKVRSSPGSEYMRGEPFESSNISPVMHLHHVERAESFKVAKHQAMDCDKPVYFSEFSSMW